MECDATKQQEEKEALAAHNAQLRGENKRLEAARSKAQGEVCQREKERDRDGDGEQERDGERERDTRAFLP